MTTDEPIIRASSELWLSPIVEGDRDRCIELINDREIERRMLKVPHPYGAAEFDQFLNVVRAATEEHGCPLHFAVRHSEHGMVGGFGFEAITPGHQLEFGYWVGQRYWGRGYMTSVVRAACQFAVSEWSVVRVIAHVFDGNEASARVLEKRGFQHEGLLRRRFLKGEALIDAHLYAWLP